MVEVNGVLAAAAPFDKPGACHLPGSLSGSLLRAMAGDPQRPAAMNTLLSTGSGLR